MPMDEQNLHRAVSTTSSTSPPMKSKRTTGLTTTPGPPAGVVQQLVRLAVASTTTAATCGGPWPWSFLVQLQDGGCPGGGNGIASSTKAKNMGAGVLVSAFQVRLQQQKKATMIKKRVIQTKRGGQNASAQKIPKNQGARPAVEALPKVDDGQRAKGKNSRAAPRVVVDPAVPVVTTEDVVDSVAVADGPANGRTSTTDYDYHTSTVEDDDRSTEEATNTNGGVRVLDEDEDNASVLSLTSRSTSFATSPPSSTRRTSKGLVSTPEKSESAKEDHDYLTKVRDNSALAAASTSLLSTQSSSSHLEVCASETTTCAQGKYREPVDPLCKCPEAKPVCLMVTHFDGRCFESKEACQKDEEQKYPECLTVGEHMRCPECLENANVKRAVTEELCVAHDACVTAVWDKEKMGEPPLSQTGLPFPEDEEPPLLEALQVQQGKSTYQM